MKPYEKCTNHIPVQHRDGKEPWCPKCGLTRDYVEPATRFSSMKDILTPPSFEMGPSGTIKEIEVEHVGDGFVRKVVAFHISKGEVIRGDPRAYEELITKKLEEEAGLESHYNKPFVSRRVYYIPDAEVYRISLTWFEFDSNAKDRMASKLVDSVPDDEAYRGSLSWVELENRSQVRMASKLNENSQKNNDDISEEMEPPC